MAWDPYQAGDAEMDTPAILASLRQGHQICNRQAYLAAARFQSQGLAKRIDYGLRHSYYDWDVADSRKHVKVIVRQADSIIAEKHNCPVPSNEDLLQQFYKQIDADDHVHA